MAEAGLPTLAIADGVATLQLNRPQHHNRLHSEDLHAIQRVCAQVADDRSLHALVLRAEGPSFCAGFHLGELEGAAAVEGPQLFQQTVDRIEALPLPTICRLQGGVYGGATDLALACDFRVGVLGMQLRMPAVRLGLHYYPSGLRRYVTRLGLAAAKRLFLLAPTLGAEDLLAIGYLDALAADARELDDRVAGLIEALAAGAPLALRGMKSSLNEIARFEYELERLRAREAECAASDDLREGQAAFAEKRAPRFQGR